MADIGSTLREARMRARIDISEVEVGTKIRAKYLRALENEEWDLLPGPVYVKSFLKTYGDFLGLDSRLLVDEFKRRYERPSDQEFRAMASTTRERDRRPSRPSRPSRLGGALLSPRSVIVVALVVIVVALYVIGSHNGGKNPTGGGNPITPATTTTGSGITPALGPRVERPRPAPHPPRRPRRRLSRRTPRFHWCRRPRSGSASRTRRARR